MNFSGASFFAYIRTPGFLLFEIPHIKNRKTKRKEYKKMDKEKLIKKEIQKGVILYVGSAIGMKDNKIVMDIDVADNVKEVEIWHDFRMPDINKSFPNVEKLIIKEYVIDINIPNSLFPNVKYVESENEAFLSGKYLVGTFYRSNTLFNTFCQKPGEVIDITRIDGIANFAFSGCKADEMVVCDSITSFHQVSANAFVDSAFSAKPFVNGLKLAGALVLEVDKTAESIELPDTPYNYVFLETADMSHVKKLTVHHPDASNKLCFKNDIPETIVLKTDKELTFSDIAALAHHSTSKGSLQNFSIIHPDFEEIDGVVYTKDRKTLVACSMSKKYVEVLDGTEAISINAFTQCNIEEVILPDSLKTAGEMAFADCEMLKNVKFGNGLKVIGRSAFAWCHSLKHIDFPPSLECIDICAFFGSALKEADLNEGLKSFESEAFGDTPIKELCIPSSIEKLNCNSITINIRKLKLSTMPKDLLSSFSKQSFGYRTLKETYVVVECGKKYLYMPRDISLNTSCLCDEIEEKIRHYFFDIDAPGYISLLEYSTTNTCRDAVAVEEFCDFGNEDAKKHIKKHIGRILPMLLDEKNEECISTLIMANIISDDTLEELRETANQKNMLTVQAYLLEHMDNKKNAEKKSQTFQL